MATFESLKIDGALQDRNQRAGRMVNNALTLKSLNFLITYTLYRGIDPKEHKEQTSRWKMRKLTLLSTEGMLYIAKILKVDICHEYILAQHLSCAPRRTGAIMGSGVFRLPCTPYPPLSFVNRILNSTLKLK